MSPLGGLGSLSESAIMTGGAALLGNGLTYGTNVGEVKVAGATTDIPVGIAAAAAAQNANVGLHRPGAVYPALAGTAVTVHSLVVSGASGKFATGTKGGTATEADYVWGSAWTGAAADLDYFQLDFNWYGENIT